MSGKNNSPVDRRVGRFVIIIFSIIPALIAGVFTYFPFQWYSRVNELTVAELNLYYSFLIVGIVYILSLYIGLYYGRAMYGRKNSKSLELFQSFTDDIHKASNERQLFESLHSFLTQTYSQSKVSVFRKNAQDLEKNVWENYPHSHTPICGMNPRSCPVVIQGNECFVNDIKTDITCAYQLPFVKSGSYICLNFSIDEVPHAVVQLYHHEKDFFDIETVLNIKTYVSSLTAPAKEKIQMNSLNIEAYTDKLTMVKNRAFLEHEFVKLIEHAIKNNVPLSIIMMDLDFFKKVNDTFGHPAGDCILIEFANIIQKCIRSGDIVARYGGEEFMVILPNANAAYATSIAERIRKTVATDKMPVFQGVQLPKITCSLGVSTYPDYASDKNALIKTADLALYAAKHGGRNKVVTYDPYNSEIVSINK